MKIAITGSTGFLGKRLCTQLNELGHTAFGYDISEGYDICNFEQLEEFVKEHTLDTIIHLAAIADLNIFQQNPEIGEKININGTNNILRVCNLYKIRMLFASTCCAYGNNNTFPSDETSPLATVEPYALSKIISENGILKYGLPHCCMRLATFYGPQMRKALAPAVFMEAIHHGKVINVHGNGLQTRTMTYVDDIVSGIVTIATTEPKYDVVNISTTESVSVLDMIKTVEECVKRNAIVNFGEDREHQTHREEISNNRLQSLGWKCNTTFKQGIHDSYEWYLKNGAKFDY